MMVIQIASLVVSFFVFACMINAERAETSGPDLNMKVNISVQDGKGAMQTVTKHGNDVAGSSKIIRIVVDGGVAGGRTTFLEKMQTDLPAKGYDVYVVPEVPATLFQGGAKPDFADWNKFKEFESSIIQLQLLYEESFLKNAKSTGKPSVVFFDLGLLDVKAFLEADKWNEVLKDNSLTEEQVLARYDFVLHMTTAANGAEQYFRTQKFQSDTPEFARMIDKNMIAAYSAHPKVTVVDNLDDGFAGKIQRATDAVYKAIGITGSS